MNMVHITARKSLYLVLCVSIVLVFVWYVGDSPDPRHERRKYKHQHLRQTFQASHKTLSPSNVVEVNRETLALDEITEEEDPANQRCLHSNPPAFEEEFIPSFKGSKDGYICRGDYKRPITWDINFNIERHFRFCSKRGGCHVTSSSIRTERNVTGIPKLLHFIWSNDMVPNLFVKNLKRFKRLHPKWAIHFWTIKSGREFIKDNEPHLLAYFDHYKRDVDRADMLRYVILFHHGGAYFDLDSTPVKPLDILTDKYDCIVSPEPIENAVVVLKMRSVLANSGIMCVSKHSFLRFVIDSLIKHGRKMAGPLFFSDCFNTFLRYQLFPETIDPTFKIEEDKPGFQFNNKISIVRHEYFEYYLNNIVNVSDVLSKECQKYESKVKNYLDNCKPSDSSPPRPDCIVPLSKDGWSTKLFQACVEWIHHGGLKRTVGKYQVFLKHIHYGTYTKANFIKHNPGPRISSVLPNAIIHT